METKDNLLCEEGINIKLLRKKVENLNEHKVESVFLNELTSSSHDHHLILCTRNYIQSLSQPDLALQR